MKLSIIFTVVGILFCGNSFALEQKSLSSSSFQKVKQELWVFGAGNDASEEKAEESKASKGPVLAEQTPIPEELGRILQKYARHL